MKRRYNIDDEQSKLSQLLFKKSKDLAEKLIPKTTQNINTAWGDEDNKPAWIDEDDDGFQTNVVKNTKSQALYTDKLIQKYENLIGTPAWAKLDKVKTEDKEYEVVRSVGHLEKRNITSLPKSYLEVKRFPKINAETGNEGPIVTCVEFHPKISATLVAGQSGVVSLFSVGGDVNNKLHCFKLKQFKVSSAQFTADGSEAFLSSKTSHNYCIYNLIKAEPKLVQLPQVVKRPSLFKMSSNGKYIATSAGFDEIYLISTESRELLRILNHGNKVQSVAFSHDSEQLYAYGVQGEVKVWDLSTFRVLKKFYDSGCVTASCITVSACGRLLATGSGEGIVNIYETAKLSSGGSAPVKTISNLTTKITSLRFNPTTEILAAASGNYPNAVKLVHIPSYHVFGNFPKPSSNLHKVETINFSPNSGFMALGNNKGCAYLYRLKYYKNY